MYAFRNIAQSFVDSSVAIFVHVVNSPRSSFILWPQAMRTFITICLATFVLLAARASAELGVCEDCLPGNRPCCTSGEFCADQTPCCGSCPSGVCGCQPTCTKNCTGLECGFGGCAEDDCGTCKPGSFCRSGTCVADDKCHDCLPGNNPCCKTGELCPGMEPCCGVCKTGQCGCRLNCTKNCDGLQCGFGGCTDTDCGTCKPGSFCYQGRCMADDKCHNCKPGNGPCCIAGEMCPGGTPCCGVCVDNSACGCRLNCTKNCTGLVCGFGGCTDNDCGTCLPGSRCGGTACFCDGHCQCKCKQGNGGGSCPQDSQGCDPTNGCTCQAPKQPAKTIVPLSNWVTQTQDMYQCCSTYPTTNCFSYGIQEIPTGFNTTVFASYIGERGCATVATVIFFFSGVPTSGEDLYLYFGGGCYNYCGYESFFVTVSNCTNTAYAPCGPEPSSTCPQQGCSSVASKLYFAGGQGTGIWITNPGTSIITVAVSIGDMPQCANAASIALATGDISLSWHEAS